jgi:hypothetical protein
LDEVLLIFMGGLALFPRGKSNGEGGGRWATGQSCASGDEKDGMQHKHNAKFDINKNGITKLDTRL